MANSRRGGRARGAACVLAASQLAWAAPATASTVGVVDVTLGYKAAAGEVNNIDVSYSEAAGAYVFTDPGAVIGVGEGCTSIGPHEAHCAPPTFWYVAVDAGDMGDTVTALRWVIVEGGSGNDNLTGGDLSGGAGDDHLVGSVEADDLKGGSGDDTLDGGDGFDTLTGGSGADHINGGDNLGDIVLYTERTSGVTVDLDGATGDDGEAGEGDSVGSDVENVFGGSGNDTLGGNAQTNELRGGAGNDTLSGLGGDDFLRGDEGGDTFIGGTGMDYVSYIPRYDDVTVDVDGIADDGAVGESDNVGLDVENVQGGYGNDTLVGSSVANVLDGSFGTDVLRGAGGADVFNGDASDTIDYSDHAGSVSLTLDGVANDGSAGENDNVGTSMKIVGGTGNDNLVGNPDGNWLDGGGGDDVLDGGGGDDHIAGGADDDLLLGGPGRTVFFDGDVFAGGPGLDTVDYSDRTAQLQVDPDGDSRDDGEGGEGDSVDVDVEIILAGSGNDVLRGNEDANTLDGGAGDDWLWGRLGADTIIGGEDHDTVDYSERTSGVSVDLDGEAGDDGALDEHDSVGGDVEDVIGGSGGDTLIGNGSDNFLDGRAGGDTLNGGEGTDRLDYSQRTAAVHVEFDGLNNDGQANEHDNVMDFEVISGGTKSDVILAGAQASTITGGLGDDDLESGAGDDVLLGGPGDDYLDAGLGKDDIAGGTGFDFASYVDRVASVRVDLDGVADDGGAGEADALASIEGLVGGAGDDALVGNGAENVFYGGAGEDRLDGAGGKDVLLGQAGADGLVGGGGDDAFDGGPGADTFSGGAGFDYVDYSVRTRPVRVDLDGARDDGQSGEHDRLRTDVEGAIGGHAGDRLTGNSRRNSFAGGAGADYLVGGGGVDGLWGENGNDTIIGRDGDPDLVNGGRGTDRASVDRTRDVWRSIEVFL